MHPSFVCIWTLPFNSMNLKSFCCLSSSFHSGVVKIHEISTWFSLRYLRYFQPAGEVGCFSKLNPPTQLSRLKRHQQRLIKPQPPVTVKHWKWTFGWSGGDLSNWAIGSPREVPWVTVSLNNLPQLDFVGCADAVAGILAIMVRAQCHEDVLRRFLGHAVNKIIAAVAVAVVPGGRVVLLAPPSKEVTHLDKCIVWAGHFLFRNRPRHDLLTPQITEQSRCYPRMASGPTQPPRQYLPDANESM